MIAEESTIEKTKSTSKLKDYVLLLKLRLAFLVVLSAVAGYLFVGGGLNLNFIYLILGGFLITGASNGLNQVIERDVDKLMDRTSDRPIPAGRMSVNEALIASIICAIVGSVLLFQLNYFSGILGILALVMYVFLYTPLKRITPWAVFVGAFPGAIPPMLGVVAITGTFDLTVGIIFLVQFIWQFPHFWAIAWVLNDDYAKGGFALLPSKSGKTKRSAFHILLYTLFMVPVSLLPWLIGLTGDITLVVATVAGAWFFWKAYKLYLNLDDKSARSLMFASFIYLPVIQFLYVFDKF
ncbi:heme o synthase [Crocinitomix catalasitica]|uniref:heme o synthase n=1 Tax=Crocinitomix catalasitica TaxID=184607 RepID=UPI00055C443C|nr:heme o synthase [Crocinitomix catalasitica]